MSNVGKKDFSSRFALGDRVIVDGCDRLIMTVTGVMVGPESISYRGAWFHEGRSTQEWFDDFRIERAKHSVMR